MKKIDADVSAGWEYQYVLLNRLVSVTWYVYCQNRPLTFIDPTGNRAYEDGTYTIDTQDWAWNGYQFGYWNNYDGFFTGEWWKDSAKLDSATAFLKYFDFEWKHNWVRGAFDGGKMRNDYTAADIYGVQTIQAIMGIDVTGFYDAKTHYAAAQLQLMYNIQNSKSGVFGINTLLTAAVFWSGNGPGGEVVKTTAESWALNNGGYTLEQTSKGIGLTSKTESMLWSQANESLKIF